MKAMLFAAGLGTRLKPFTNHHPKALVEINGKTLLERSIRYRQSAGIYEVVINVHHYAPQIEDMLIGHNGFGSTIAISDERNELLETGGGLKKAASFFNDDDTFVVMNVDVLTDLDLKKVIAAHRKNTAIATLAVMKRNSSRHFLFDDAMHLCGWTNNNTQERRISRDASPLHPFAFSGVQVLSGTVLRNIPFEGKFSLVDLYLHLAKENNIMGYDHTGDVFIDVGKPGSVEEAEQLFD
jgi:N-acetyl-alpha-D-muramate 1-phosphate uridylyltransferase